MRERARKLRTVQTKPERILWKNLKKRQIRNVKFRRQYIIGFYIVDFVSLSHKLIIELDGCQHQLQQEYDRIRTGFLIACGYKVIRFWNNQILLELDSVLNTILKEVSE
jgi:very-short-patch-repair endonuclease